MRDAEGLARGVGGEAALDRLARREGHGMHENVEMAPVALHARGGGVDLGVDGDVERHQQLRADRGGERLDALAEAVIGVAEGELRALRVHGLGDAPGDRAVGRHANDQGALAREHPHAAIPS